MFWIYTDGVFHSKFKYSMLALETARKLRKTGLYQKVTVFNREGLCISSLYKEK